MTIKDLIKRLSQLLDQDAVIEVFDADAEKFQPVTGVTYGGNDHRVRLYSDEPAEKPKENGHFLIDGLGYHRPGGRFGA